MRARPAAVAVVGWLAATNVARSVVVPGSWHLAWNLGIGAGAVAIGRAAGLSTAELGLARADVGRGLRWGAAAFGAVAAPVVLARLVPAADGLWEDGRVDVGLGEMLLRALVVIPLGTVLVEELAFRGVLHGLLLRLGGRRLAYGAGAVLFGLWHLTPTLRGALADGTSPVPITAGTVLATTAAGVVFLWLRERSGSVVAPMLAHVATNSVVFAVAWSAAR